MVLVGYTLKLSDELNFASNRPNIIHTSPAEKKTQNKKSETWHRLQSSEAATA
jgi:hypothetical protein